MRTLDPGRMTARMDLEIPVEVSDGQGGARRTFANAATLWALIEPRMAILTGGRDEAVADIEHDVWIRYRTDIAKGMRFRKGNRLFGVISAFDPDETRRYLVCRCRETGR
jgi:SPP1 family predicted phage head-tail adaptor